VFLLFCYHYFYFAGRCQGCTIGPERQAKEKEKEERKPEREQERGW
jgi:hypothetical protein